MDDAKIKEEFEKFQDLPELEEELKFAITVDPAIEWREDAIGFYAGFRSAERLAKIEVLEEALKKCTGHSYAFQLTTILSKMLSDLKDGQ